MPQEVERGQCQRAELIAHGNEAGVTYGNGGMLVNPAGTTASEEDARLSEDAALAYDQAVPRGGPVGHIGEVVLARVRADVVG